MGGAAKWWLHHSLARLSAELESKGARLLLRRRRGPCRAPWPGRGDGSRDASVEQRPRPCRTDRGRRHQGMGHRAGHHCHSCRALSCTARGAAGVTCTGAGRLPAAKGRLRRRLRRLRSAAGDLAHQGSNGAQEQRPGQEPCRDHHCD
ncbi:hypothetical protein [Arthrobacter sp. NPDC093139]|uniref:hypothetical protein n=1 Tax=Arthrobacter sp. NPDC093139 TaxID=3363945 RepID=UPI003827D083